MKYKKQLMLVLVDFELFIFIKNMCQERERESKKEGDRVLLYILINKIDEWYFWILEFVKREDILRYRFELEKQKEKSINR